MNTSGDRDPGPRVLSEQPSLTLGSGRRAPAAETRTRMGDAVEAQQRPPDGRLWIDLDAPDPDASDAPGPPPDFAHGQAFGRSLRVALAMKGGVSLAVWIGGAVAELDILRRIRIIGSG